MDYFLDENVQTEKYFNLEGLLDFQIENDVQIIRGEDGMYCGFVNGKCYSV